MKNFIFALLLLVVTLLSGALSGQAYLDPCTNAETAVISTYGTSTVGMFVADPCDVQGTHMGREIQPVSFPALCVGSFSNFPSSI